MSRLSNLLPAMGHRNFRLFYAGFVVSLLGDDEIRAHAEEYRRAIEALRDGRIDLDAARRRERLNAALDDILMTDRG